MKKMFLLLTIVINLIAISVSAFASDTTFLKEKLSTEKTNDLIEDLAISVVYIEPKSQLNCIDISDDNTIAVGSSYGTEGVVSFYDSEGGFKHSFVFNSSGSFGLEWEKENIKIFFERGDYEVTVNADGEVLDASVITNVNEIRNIVDSLYFSTKSVVGDTTYELKKTPLFLNKISSSYSQLIITDASGNTNILCDVSDYQAKETAILLVFFTTFFPTVFIIVTKIENKKDKD